MTGIKHRLSEFLSKGWEWVCIALGLILACLAILFGSWRDDRYVWALLAVVAFSKIGAASWHVFVSPLLTPKVLLILEGMLAGALTAVAALCVKRMFAWVERAREGSRASARLESLVRGEEDQ